MSEWESSYRLRWLQGTRKAHFKSQRKTLEEECKQTSYYFPAYKMPSSMAGLELPDFWSAQALMGGSQKVRQRTS